MDSAAEPGFRRNDDFNGARQDGTGGYPVNIVDGVRQNSALVYLTPQVRSRPNLTVLGDITIDKVIVEGGTARGVVNAPGTVFRAGEVVLSAGSYGSPAILMRSGVGPAEDLRALGIDVVADLPVRRRLQAHPFFHAEFALAPEHQTLTSAFAAHLWPASSEARAGELDLGIVATHLPDGSFSPTGGAIVRAAAVTRPESRGSVRLASRDPHDAPVIDNNCLATAGDRRRMLEAVRLVRRLASTLPLAGALAAELVPGDAVRSDEELGAAIATGIATYGPPDPGRAHGRARGRVGRRWRVGGGERAGGAARGRRLDHARGAVDRDQRDDHHDRGAHRPARVRELTPRGAASCRRSRTRGVCPGPFACGATLPDLSRTSRPLSRTA